MIATICLLALVGLSAAGTQKPKLTKCPGQEEEVAQYSKFVIKDATLGGTLDSSTKIKFTEELDDDPILHIKIARPDGTQLPCIPGLWQCDLKLCDGTTASEKQLNADWNNKCPIEPGRYRSSLSFPLPDNSDTREFFGDGDVVVTLEIENANRTVNCVTLPLKVDVN